MVPIGSTAAALVTDVTFQEKIHRLGMRKQIISDEEMKNISKIAKSLEETTIIMKSASETIENENKAKEKKIY